MTSLKPPLSDSEAAHQLHPPAPCVGVAGVHPKEVGGEQSRLFAAGSGTDLEDDVLVVVGVLGQQQKRELLLQILQRFLQLGKFEPAISRTSGSASRSSSRFPSISSRTLR